MNIVQAFQQSPQHARAGHLLHSGNLHMTLHFIGGVTARELNCLKQAAQTVSSEAFSLVLDRYGYFNQAKVYWMGMLVYPRLLGKLHKSLGEALLECGYQIDCRPYRPHITLMRNLEEPGRPVPFKAINWHVKDFVLLESVPVSGGISYEVIQRYALSAGI